jgi:hypothetical protein
MIVKALFNYARLLLAFRVMGYPSQARTTVFAIINMKMIKLKNECVTMLNKHLLKIFEFSAYCLDAFSSSASPSPPLTDSS